MDTNRQEAIRMLLKFPQEYSLGDIIFAVFQTEAVKNGVSLNFLRQIENADAYILAEKALNKETDE